LPGGHVDPGESLEVALAREIREETGWSLSRILALVATVDWKDSASERVTKKRQFEFLVEVEGDLSHPFLEQKTFTEYRWVGSSEVEILRENRDVEDTLIFDVVATALAHRGFPRNSGGWRRPRLFVSFEGIDLAGKSTLAPSLTAALQDLGLRVVYEPEFPGRLDLAASIERALQRSIFVSEGFEEGARAALTFMIHGAALGLEGALAEEPDVLIADRGLDSLAIYQGWFVSASREEFDPFPLLLVLENLFATMSLPLPDRILLLRAPLEEIGRRFAARHGRPLAQKEANQLAQFQALYQNLARRIPRYRTLDTSQSAENVVSEALAIVIADLDALERYAKP
jgi:thymidylate kinase/8-oxo-dGTP pyrophosphatase MutT (NUDIX family)